MMNLIFIFTIFQQRITSGSTFIIDLIYCVQELIIVTHQNQLGWDMKLVVVPLTTNAEISKEDVVQMISVEEN